MIMGDGTIELMVGNLSIRLQPPPFPMWEQKHMDGEWVLRHLHSVIHGDQCDGILCGEWHLLSGAGHHIKWDKISYFNTPFQRFPG